MRADCVYPVRDRGYFDKRVSSMICNVAVGNWKSGIFTRLHRLQNREDAVY